MGQITKVSLSVSRLPLLTTFIVLLIATPAFAQRPPTPQTQNLFVVTIDGMRWQEVFDGADPVLLEHRLGGVKEVKQTKARYGRETLDGRRQALMPFFWSIIAKDGQIFGDVGSDSESTITNRLKISYPGYAEMFCGFADPRVVSNDAVPNPNPTVFQWLAQKPGYKGKIAAFCTWDIFLDILNADQCGFPVVAGWNPVKGDNLTDRERFANDLVQDLPKLWVDNTYDAVTGYAAMEYIKKNHPRICYIGFGETDEWAHLRRYDCYLDAVHRNDAYLRDLWRFLQNDPQYKGKSTLLVTTDHGRGDTLVDWTDHSRRTAGAERIWIALLGPDTPNMGVRKGVNVTQSQIAATIAELLGEDYHAAVPKSAKPLPDAAWQAIPPLGQELRLHPPAGAKQ